MIRKTLFHYLPVFATACLLVFTSCQKEESAETPDTETIEAETMAELEFSALESFVDEASDSEEFLNGRTAAANNNLPPCATRTFDSTTRTLTINFGTTNCICRDGKTRRGKIVATLEGRLREAGSSVTITLQDYYVNDNHHTGTKTKTYVNANKMNVVVRDARIETTRGTLEWSAARVVERIAGGDTRLLTDDVFTITGRSAGLNRRGIKYNTVIEQPLKLVMAHTCVRNFVAGVVRTTTENGNTLILNYDPVGGEPCDKVAELTVNGRSKMIELR